MIEGLTRKALILSLIDQMGGAGSWCGETHIQKCCYFLQAMLGVPMGFNFILYKHGPFSFELRDELTSMRADGLLSIQIRNFSYGPSFTLGPNAQVVKERFTGVARKYRGQIDFVVGHLSAKGVAELERLGTALLVTKEEGILPVEERASMINQLKPHVSTEEALDAVKAVDCLYDKARELGLIEAQGILAMPSA